MTEKNPWPALECSETLPQQLKFERGVWGKVHGARSDFRWIAVSPSFNGRENALERNLFLGDESAATTFSMWRTLGNTHYAIHCYPSRAQDADGRSGFLEKQILEWQRPANLPALLGSLLLLSQPATDEIWWEQAKEIKWLESDAVVLLEGANLPVSWQEIEQCIKRGCQSLADNLSEEKLSDFYAQILAKQPPSLLVEHSLKAEALAVLLLPLPRSIADKLSLTGWLPAKRTTDVDKLRLHWDVICTNTVLNTSKVPSPEQRREAKKMSQAVLANEPRLLNQVADKINKSSFSESSEVQFTLWGPSSAGKTVFLAQLYVEATLNQKNWNVFLTPESLEFTENMRFQMRRHNKFPAATAVGELNNIVYHFQNTETNENFSLLIEDRAGADYELFEESAQERLRTVEGLILLFDHLRGAEVLEQELWDTLGKLQVANGHKIDDRPIAVCISKADILVQNMADYRLAKDAPDEFVREHLPANVLKVLDNFCSNYRFFPVSAAGLHIRHGSIEPTVFYDENLKARICPVGKPFNLLAPIAWLNQQLHTNKT